MKLSWSAYGFSVNPSTEREREKVIVCVRKEREETLNFIISECHNLSQKGYKGEARKNVCVCVCV